MYRTVVMYATTKKDDIAQICRVKVFLMKM